MHQIHGSLIQVVAAARTQMENSVSGTTYELALLARDLAKKYVAFVKSRYL